MPAMNAYMSAVMRGESTGLVRYIEVTPEEAAKRAEEGAKYNAAFEAKQRLERDNNPLILANRASSNPSK
ncbi:MAG: hypothetical protein ACRC9Y_09515 [Aeromonas veronii]